MTTPNKEKRMAAALKEPKEKPAQQLVVPETSYSKRDAPVVQHPQAATSLVQALAAAAQDPRTDMDKMERLWAMHQSMVKQQAEAEFNGAMARAQAKIQPIATDRENDHTHSRYATLKAINKVIGPIYSAEGLAVSFDTETKNDADPIPEGEIRTVAYVSHSGGHTRRYHIDLPPDDVGAKGNTNKTKVQAKGSTNEYARRYLTRMIFNLATGDDTDGNPVGGKLDEKIVADHLAAIDGASKDDLQKVFGVAWNASEKAKDKAAQRLFIQHKDERKVKLGIKS
jgi:hypothetical protein